MSKNSTNVDRDYLPSITTILNIYYPLILSLAATLGNLFSFYIFQSRIFHNNGACYFLKQKAIVDTLNVYICTLRYSYNGLTSFDLKNSANFWCYLLSIGVYTIDPMSSWLSVLISLDRCVAVLLPSIYRTIAHINLRRIQNCALLISFSTIGLMNFTKFFFIKYENKTYSNITTASMTCLVLYDTYFALVSLILTLIIPFIIMTTSSAIVAFKLIETKSRIHKYRSNESNSNNSSCSNTSAGVSNNTTKKNNSGILSSHNGFTKKNMAIIKTVLCLDVCFLVFNTPRFVVQLAKGNSSLGLSAYNFVLQLSTILKYSYYSFTIVFYIVANNIFRNKVNEIFSNVVKCLSKYFSLFKS
jgi:hypothetical protein